MAKRKTKTAEPEITVDDLIKERNRLKEESKKLSKQIMATRRKEAAEKKRKERAETQAEALAFIEYCKVTKMDEKPDSQTIYEWVKEHQANQQKPDKKSKS